MVTQYPSKLGKKARHIDQLLVDHFGGPFIPSSRKDPLSELVSALLSHRTKHTVTREAYLRLTNFYPNWEAVMNTQVRELMEVIDLVSFPEVKAPRIQGALRYVNNHNNNQLSLDFLADLSVEAARQWLESIPGVGAKTSAAVLSFSRLRRRALVVDTHHLRVAQRIGIVPPKASLERGAKLLQSYLPKDWDSQRVYDSHQGFMRLGQKVCHWQTPDCKRCVVRKHCDFFQNNFRDAQSGKPLTEKFT